MSQIPRPGFARPGPNKNTSTVSTRTATGGTRIITNTKFNAVEPAGGQGGSGCNPCPSVAGAASRSTRIPGTSGIPPPSSTRGAPTPGIPRGIPTPGRARLDAPQTVQAKAKPLGAKRTSASVAKAPTPMQPGQYVVPAPYGPQSRGGRDMTYSSPQALRGQMEARVPKSIKFSGVKPCPASGNKDVKALAGTKMGDTFAGNFSIYGGQGGMDANLSGNNELDERMNEEMAAELFNLSSPLLAQAEDEAGQELLNRSMLDPEDQVYAKAHNVQHICQPRMIDTPAGKEPVIQETYTEKIVERDEYSEKIIKNLVVSDTDDEGKVTRITISEQQLDPDYNLPSEGKDIVTVKETISLTPSYKTSAKDVRHETITPKIDIDPNELARLVEEEIEDVENTLKMVPPDLSLQEDRVSVKKRLQKLRLNTESMILIEESVVNPPATADEPIAESPPETLANIMHTVESGVTPACPPDQVFHTLFEEKLTEQSVILSSVGPGPLQDVMVPQVLTKEIHKESMTPDLTDLTNIYKNVTDAKDWPPVDIFATVMDAEAKSPKKEIKSRPFKPIADEEMPWGNEDIEPLVNIVGAEPVAVLGPANISDLEKSGNVETELAHGIEYFVDADPVQYMSRVQLRGTNPPPWFPGYIFALPEFPDVVKIARNPDEVFISSWKSCQPRIIPEESFSILH
ncbi:uncharacterized protein LOC126739149 [Anthonomus grandis grandis]|uniref:uncharacterized protein LOC126739149 n=1 Tax=Anthonomus grandis grandis TaxID=2921223 RepID=UPI0021663E37|nr:uncharacterized protein LOC126739149 [Anthonomus grandis grandis]